MGMKPDSRTIIHVGVNYLVAPNLVMSHNTLLTFQQAILSEGLEYQHTDNSDPDKFLLVRETPTSLKVIVANVPPGQIGQFLVLAEKPNRPLDTIVEEAVAAQRAFFITWPQPVYQIVKCDVTLRELHETTEEHAFKDLWESRLKQTPEALNVFGRPLLGGGIRLVFPPREGDNPPVHIDVKIESFLRNPRKLFIETQFLYPLPTQPCPPDQDPFNIKIKLHEINDFVSEKVISFIAGEKDASR